ncbi:hypothetical protein VCRA2110O2_30279 [Vibrio crassostreae]|nr:hypothetical protein VCRA2110O2_30279 [Vibrio crassostreae]
MNIFNGSMAAPKAAVVVKFLRENFMDYPKILSIIVLTFASSSREAIALANATKLGLTTE